MRLTVLVIFLYTPVVLMAQLPELSYVGPTAEQFKNSEVHVSWTIGEAITESFSTSSIQLSQGFQQHVTLKVNDVFIPESNLINVNVYPNPTMDMLQIELQDLSNDIVIELSDINGRSVFKTIPLTGKKHQLDFSEHKTGMYILTVRLAETNQIINISKIQILR